MSTRVNSVSFSSGLPSLNRDIRMSGNEGGDI